ncbi:toxin-antitoxin system, toxin component [Streptomyces gardneri]|uniref:toxin-antitoxin system, toxin component n=1 Tax=Streptomyces gardneri TaxID=66892 RepID=UPI00367FB06A
MKRHCDELFAGVGSPVPGDVHQLLREMCAYLTRSSGREVRLMFESFPPDTVSGLWLDMGDYDQIVVEANTAPLHQVVIMGHELWHRHEGGCGHYGGAATATAAARALGERWGVEDAVARVAARTSADGDEERRAERFGHMLAARLRPYLEGGARPAAVSGVAGRILASLEG